MPIEEGFEVFVPQLFAFRLFEAVAHAGQGEKFQRDPCALCRVAHDLELAEWHPAILATMREERVLPRSFGCVDYFHTIDPTLQKIVADPENNVVAVLSGHLHLTGVVKENDIHHIVTSGTASYPCDFAYYEVFHDRIHVQMVTLPEELVTPDTDIHGPPRWPTAYTDSNHLTHYSYVAGNPSERSFDIPISLPDLSAPSCSAVGPPE